MKLSGFSFVRNGVTFDYPFVESISSILPICDEFIIAVGNSADDTLDRIVAIRSPKIKIIETVWDESLRTGGQVLAQQTNLALDHVTGDWAFYLQADEVVHEKDLPKIVEAIARYDGDRRVEGLLFSYHHFYGSYRYVGTSRGWYRKEIRIVRTGIGVRSWRDAQGFRIAERKLRVKAIDASVYHYGWVKAPETQMAKQRSFNKLWHSDEGVVQRVGTGAAFEYQRGRKLEEFASSHPSVMKERLQKENWNFQYDPSRVNEPMNVRFLDWIESRIGVRIGEYRNYELLP